MGYASGMSSALGQRLQALRSQAWDGSTRARAIASGVIDLFPVTPLGLALGMCAFAALRSFAYEELDLVWLVTGYAALGLCALAPLFVIPCAVFLRLRMRNLPVEDALFAETGSRFATGFRLPALAFVPFVQVRWQWLSPSGADIECRRDGQSLLEVARFGDRGRHEQVVRRVMVQDPFGLTRVAFRMPEVRSLCVLPRLDGLAKLASLTALAAGEDLPHPMGLEDGDRLELARYTPGDPARFIHWKVFARTRKLLVRRPERAVAIARRCAAFYVAGPGDDASAAAARLALERRLLGSEWVFGTDRAVFGTSRVDEALNQLVESVHARHEQARGLSPFLASVDKQGPASVLVFAPPRPGAWLGAVIASSSRRQLRTVIAVDGLAELRSRPLWRRLLASDEPIRGSDSAALDQVLATLGRAHVPVILLDRTTGRPLGERARRALTQDARSRWPAVEARGAVASSGVP
jgi:uncharacterized protein (DUF58 family)